MTFVSLLGAKQSLLGRRIPNSVFDAEFANPLTFLRHINDEAIADPACSASLIIDRLNGGGHDLEIRRPGAARGADWRSPLPPLSRPKAPRSFGSRSCGLSGISASFGTGERPPRGRLASGLLRPLVMLSRTKIAVVGLHTLITCMALTWGGPSPPIVGSGLPTHGHPCVV